MKLSGIWVKHKKKIMAFVMSVLMVAFTLPMGLGRSGPADVEVGKLDGQVVHSSALQAARSEFDRLRGYRIKTQNEYDMPRSVLQILPPQVLQQAELHDDFWFLLLAEARRTGAAPSQDTLKTFLTNYVELPSTLTVDQEVTVEHDIRDLLSVRAASMRAADMVKVSQPLRQMTMAEQLQELTVKLVEYPVGEFRAHVPEPTPQQIQQQFTEYGNKDPLAPDASNRFGFGYKYPDRVKLQYIGVRRSDVMNAVKASKSAYDWDVAAERYYFLNKSTFTAPPPASTQPSAKPASSEPVIQPFQAVRSQILETIQDQDADKLEQAVMTQINSAMMGDYQAWRTSPGTSSKPASSLGPEYGSYEYLQALAAAAQKQHGVLPVVGAVNELTPARELGKVPGGVGNAYLPMSTQQIMQQQPPVYLGTYLDHTVEAFAPDAPKERALKLMQPTPEFETGSGDKYIARVTDAAPARMPADVKDVRQQVVDDLKKAAAYAMAKAAADQVAAAAKKEGIEQAAVLSARRVTQAGPFDARSTEVPGLTLSDPSAVRQFVAQAVRLVRTDPKAPHAVSVIELPREGRVIVAELVKAAPSWGDANSYEADAQIDQGLWQQLGGMFLSQWFDYANAAARLGWVYEGGKHGVEGGGGEPQPNPNAVPPAPRPF